MALSASDIILHNYPQSPVAEKVRVALGIKGIEWHSVEIPRLPPKPDVVKLTGGYRRTPILQVGADICCDSQAIIAALETIHPGPTLFPTADTGLLWCLSRWTDGIFFDQTVKIVLGAQGDALDPAFAADRGRLYMGPDWQTVLKTANTELPHLLAQARAQLSWLDDMLADGRLFLTGNKPAALDAQVYHAVWFLRGRWAPGPEFIASFTHLDRWANRVEAIGHGTQHAATADDAAQAATNAEPRPGLGVASGDPQGLTIGQAVRVEPDVNGGEQPVEGKVSEASATTIAVKRTDPDLGQLVVHFPRAGYKITAI